jgi:hypothetical protein
MELERCAEQLVRSAAAIRALCAEPGCDPYIRPAPEKWSMVEVLCHLADEEREDFRLRFDLTLHRPDEPWPTIDPQAWVAERAYGSRGLADALADFLAERERSIAWLRSLGRPDLSIARQHPRVGPIHAGDLLLSWLNHDLLHVRQLVGILQAQSKPFSSGYAGTW